MKKLLPFLILLCLFAGCKNNATDTFNGTTTGTGGSLASFTISGNTLYAIDGQKINTFDISNPADPRPGTDIPINTTIETLFPYGNTLFVGSQNGMYIYDISNPAQPKWLSTYSHIVSCDPVVVQGKYAYVTLRTGTNCRRGINSLDVVDVSDLKNPRLLNSTAMLNPHGLGVTGKNLFVCEGDNGLKTFDLSDPEKPLQTAFLQNIKTFDVIPLPYSLLVVGEDGFLQYDYTQPANLQLLSKIPVQP
jgi:hypothetical protein